MTGGMPASRSLLSGKIVLILVAVVASAGGFALGYFVGQNASVSSSLLPSNPQINDTTVATDAQNANTDVKTDLPAQEARPERNPLPEGGQAAVMPVSHGASARDLTTGNSTDVLKAGQNQETERAELPESAVTSNKVAYTVQAASFKRQKDAEALKKSLEAKGYDKVSVRKEAGAKGITLFKVRVGEFEKKKEASVQAIRLNKAEGLSAFVTLKKQ